MDILSPLSLWTPFDVVVYADMLAAIVGRLRTFDDAAIPTALGETDGAPKIALATGLGQPSPPYIVINRPTGTKSYLSGGVFIWRGQIQIDVTSRTSSALQALSALIASDGTGAPGALDAPALTWTGGGRLMKFVHRSSGDIGEISPGVGSAVTYWQSLIFEVWFSGVNRSAN